MSRSLTMPLRSLTLARTARGRSAEERALAGEVDGWNELVRTHNRRVVLTLVARGIRPDSARDVAQEAWTRLIEQQRLGRLSELKMPGLVIKQALFLARDYARLGESHRQLAEQIEAEALDPQPRLWARAELQQARQILSQCTRSERQVFRAMYGGSCANAAEAARETGLSVQRVRQLLCELRKKLREARRCDD